MKQSPKASEFLVPVGELSAPWHIYPNFLTCRPDGVGREHLLRYHASGYRGDIRRTTGHGFYECTQCTPSTFMFVVFVAVPSPMATCYDISKESYDEWTLDPDGDTFPTQEMLYRLRDPAGRSLNPTWRPPR